MSAVVELKDGGGASVTVHVLDGCYFSRGSLPIPFHQHMARVRDMPLHGDDVLICGYPKSGTHSLWRIVSKLLHGDCPEKETSSEITETPELDMLDFTSIKLLNRIPAPRILGSHFRFQFLPRDVLTKKPKIIYVMRRPKAVAVSYYAMTCAMTTVRSYEGHVTVRPYRGTWDDYLEAFLQGEVEYGSWFEHVLEWERSKGDNSDLPMFFLHYDDMKQDAVGTIQKLGEFLGRSVNEEMAASLAKLGEKEFGEQPTSDTNVNSADQRDVFSLSQDGQLTRRARRGDWRQWFTVAQSERFDQVYEQKMMESGFLDLYK